MRLGTLAACALLLVSAASARAQQAPEEGETAADLSSPGEGGESSCFPECRPGFVCRDGECVSQCNPPCPQGQVCTAARECVPQGGAAPSSGAPAQWESPPPQGQAPAGGGSGPNVAAWPASEGKNAPRFIFGFHLGAAGELSDNESDFGLDLKATPGAHLRLDFPIGDYFAIGPAFFGGAWTIDTDAFGGESIDRSGYFDADLLARVRYGFGIGEVQADIYAGLAIGYSLFILNDDLMFEDKTEHGWNIGMLFGAQAFFGGPVGMMVELGWMRHAVHSLPDAGPDAGDVVIMNQFVFNLGLVVRFGG